MPEHPAIQPLRNDLIVTGRHDVAGATSAHGQGTRVAWTVGRIQGWTDVPNGLEEALALCVSAACLQDLLMRDARATDSAGWPPCPEHGDHPLEARPSGDGAAWRCARSGSEWPIGSLPSAG